jgi:methylmalonyl-CoA mutase N-terminal domain/subunit
VGVNSHVERETEIDGVFRVDPEIEKRQLESLKTRKRNRDASEVNSALGRLEKAASGNDNLFPFILDAVKCEATIGEICTTLAKQFGRYREQSGTR